MNLGTVLHQLGQEGDVALVDCYRPGNVLGHSHWDTQLPNGQVGIRCDNRTGAEVNTLAHKVAPNASMLAIQAILDRLQRTA